MNVAQNIHIVPIRTTTTDTATFVAPHVNMKLYDKVEFLIYLGALSVADMTMTVTQSLVTAGSSSTAIAARYRTSTAAGSDALGAVTTLASTGLAIANATYDGYLFIVDVDSSDLTTATKPYVGITMTTSASASMVSTIIALLWPKYPKETNADALT